MPSDADFENDSMQISRLLFYFGVTITLSIILLFQAIAVDVDTLGWWNNTWSYMTMLGVTAMVLGTAAYGLKPTYNFIKRHRGESNA